MYTVIKGGDVSRSQNDNKLLIYSVTVFSATFVFVYTTLSISNHTLQKLALIYNKFI